MKWNERNDLETATKALVETQTKESLADAIKNYEVLIGSDPGEYQLKGYKTEKLKAELKVYQMDHEANEETQRIFSWVDGEDTEPLGYDSESSGLWSDVDLKLVLDRLLNQSDKNRLNLYGDNAANYIGLAAQLVDREPDLFEAYLDRVEPNFFVSCMGGDVWSPKVMWNGGLLVRNHHRVVGISLSAIVRLPSFDVVQSDLMKMREAHAALAEDGEEPSFHTLWMLNSVDDQIVCDLDFEKINLYGNNIVGLGNLDVLAACDCLTPELLQSDYDSSRAGVALRFFEGLMLVYTFDRWTDSLDYCVDRAWLGSYDGVGDEYNNNANLSDLQMLVPRGDEGIKDPYTRFREEQAKFTKTLVNDDWECEVAHYITDLPEALKDKLGDENAIASLEMSAEEALFKRAHDSMQGTSAYGGGAEGSFNWCESVCQTIFTGHPKWTGGYSEVLASTKTAHWHEDPQNPVRLSFGIASTVTGPVDLMRLETGEQLVDMISGYGFVMDHAKVHIKLPKAGGEAEEIRPLNQETLREFNNRAHVYYSEFEAKHNTPEYEEEAKQTLAKYRSAEIDAAGQWTDSSLNIEPDLWEDFPYDIGGGVIVVDCDLPVGSSFALGDLRTAGQRLSSEDALAFVDEQGDHYTLPASVLVELPAMGLYQGYFDGDPDSGNLVD